MSEEQLFVAVMAGGVCWLGLGAWTGSLIRYRWPDGNGWAGLACLLAWPVAFFALLALVRLHPLGWRCLRHNLRRGDMPRMCPRCGAFEERRYGYDGASWVCPLCEEQRQTLREQRRSRIEREVREHNRFIRDLHGGV